MGTDYTIGVIRSFEATVNHNLSKEEWQLALNDRLDLNCFTLTHDENNLSGKLHGSIFRDQIEDFYQILGSILGEKRNLNFDYYFKDFGKDINNYQFDHASFSFKNKNGLHIQLRFTYALLFVEGKVLAEEFYTEPVLLNWLFRNSTIKNKLAGCIVSGIVG